ncbi:MAG TPA: DUF374 domain-containing protein [Candidatus Desulfofervidus auxilii]|uniref:DUF374 domain-containing protein n=1 Tax=Desulfofervidus auxilii TaxID=1621989 RepID=A0A7V0IAA5_DESA2|nr:DUF374 domain-containing protein [Candidatus Desulfofervidus auxilii]
MKNKKQNKYFKKWLVSFGFDILYWLYRTCDITLKKEAPLSNSPVIYAGWHGALPILPFIFKDKKIVTMASYSEDGELITSAFKKIGLEVIRGSTHRGGISALKNMLKVIKQGYSAGLAIDGSQGPVHKVQGGVIFLSMYSGYPLVPLNVYYQHSVKLPTWDKMEIPLPFTKVAIVFGKPFYVKKGISKKEFEIIRLKLENYLFYLREVGKAALK